MARRHNLPPQPNGLIGRERELAAACAMLRQADVRMVTLTGPAGTGKTRLAVGAGEALLDAFPDGVAFVDLAPVLDPELVLPVLCASLGLRDRDARAPLDLLRRHLEPQRALLVLDNFEQIVAAAPRLAELLAACPDLKLLVTSRARLHLRWERELPVPPLPLPDPRALPDLAELSVQPAVSLFVERARASRPDFRLDAASAPAVAELCVRLDGLPLAIELAAARARILPPQALLARVEAALSLLSGGARDQPARQQTLRGALDWSYDLLAPGEQRLFRQLGVFAGPFTLAAAEAVCDGACEGSVLDGLASLVDNSLLRPVEEPGEEPRFVMLNTVRAYAASRLDLAGEADGVRRCHAEYFLALAEAAAPRLHGPSQGRWLSRLQGESGNLRAALAWCEQGGHAELGLRLVDALWWFWLLRGQMTEGRAFVRRLLAAPGAADQPVLRAQALHAGGTLALYQSDYAAARALFEESLAIRRALGDDAGAAGALMNLGAAASQQGDRAAARAHFEEALAIHRATGDRFCVAQALQNLGNLRQEDGDLAAARRLAEESLELCRQAGVDRGVAIALHNLGNIAQDQGDVAAARRYYEESLSTKRAIGDRRSMVVSLANLAPVLAALGDPAGARARLAEALQIEQSLGDRGGLAFVLERFAALDARAHPGRALCLAGAAAALRDAIDAPLPPAAREQLESRLALARRALGAAAEKAWERGRGMSAEQAVAEALAEPERPEGGGPAGAAGPLSPREREVAGLVAAGLTNRQIAERLVIAERTADGHVASILNKLGLSSRTQVALWAVEHGLAAGTSTC